MVGVPGDLGKSLTVDPKMVKEIAASPQMRSEQGSGFMEQYGGPTQYVEMAGMSPEARQVYYSVQAGASTPEEVGVKTGLSLGVVNSTIALLERRGLISRTTVTRESGLEY